MSDGTTDPGTGIDKEKLWGEWLRHSRWSDKLHKRMVHKGLDIPEEDVIQVDNSRRGLSFGWKEIVAAGLTGLGVYSGVQAVPLALSLLKPQAESVAPVSQGPQEPIPVSPPANSGGTTSSRDTKLKVRWWIDDKGKVQNSVEEMKE